MAALIAASIRETLNRRLWRGDRGYHVAYNTSTREDITSKTYVIAFPLFAGLALRTVQGKRAHQSWGAYPGPAWKGERRTSSMSVLASQSAALCLFNSCLR